MMLSAVKSAWLSLIVLQRFFTISFAETYNGTIGIGCSGGSCNFTGVCLDLAVPGDSAGNGVYTNITGDVFLSPSTCTAECNELCSDIAVADPGCIGNAGYVYCPETQECIRPWEENCPFEGTVFVGPTNITCVNGRCNNLASTCNVAFESAFFGGPYLSGLNGEYQLSADCSATCDGCTGESAPTAPPATTSPTTTPSPTTASPTVASRKPKPSSAAFSIQQTVSVLASLLAMGASFLMF